MEFLSCFRCESNICVCYIHGSHSEPVQSIAQEIFQETSANDDLDALLASIVADPSLARTPSPTGPRLTPIRDRHHHDESFVHKCFPHMHQDSLRAKLWGLLQQPWLTMNNLEPSGDLQFLLHDKAFGGQQCVICARVFRRGGRALEHIRAHLGHRPYRCQGGFKGCPYFFCGRLFHSQEAMKDHQRRDTVQCEKCNAHVLRKNYGRHQKTKSCGGI